MQDSRFQSLGDGTTWNAEIAAQQVMENMNALYPHWLTQQCNDSLEYLRNQLGDIKKQNQQLQMMINYIDRKLTPRASSGSQDFEEPGDLYSPTMNQAISEDMANEEVRSILAWYFAGENLEATS